MSGSDLHNKPAAGAEPDGQISEAGAAEMKAAWTLDPADDANWN